MKSSEIRQAQPPRQNRGSRVPAFIAALGTLTLLCWSQGVRADGGGHGAGAVSELSVSEAGVAKAVRVIPDLEHDHPSDLVIELIHHQHHGDTKSVEVISRSHHTEALEEGVLFPEAFAGRSVGGTWSLALRDEAFGDGGELRGWTLAIESCRAEQQECRWTEHVSTHPVHIPDLKMDWSSWSFWGSIVNFALLLAILVFLGKAPIKGFLVSRRDQIQSNLLEARELRAKAQKQYDEATDRLNNLEAELESIRNDMVKAGEEERARIVADAEKKASRMRKDAAFLIEQQLKQLRIDLTRKTVQASIAAAREAVGSSITEEDQRRLADDYLSRVREIGTAGKSA